MKLLLTAGTWNKEKNEEETYGKESHLIAKMYNLLLNEKDFDIDYFNGGKYEDLEELVNKSNEYNIIFWMANVPNELPKIRDVKKVNPMALVIGSKRNHYDYKKEKLEYTFVDILNKSLSQRNNLTIEFSKLKDENRFKMLLFDPLGTCWYDGYDLKMLVESMLARIRFILTTRRERTYGINEIVKIPEHKEFFKYVRDVVEIFHKTIEHTSGITRLLGNASFRYNNKIYVSERDVDKSIIDSSKFVNVFINEEKVYYYGNKKPSKDAVVQIRLYDMLPNINYIVHSHCYAKGGYFTNVPVPCGALDEIDEVMKVIKKYYDNDLNKDEYIINLKGHGCLILANNLDLLQKNTYSTRHLPEYLKEEQV